jgi:hypothetical protein
VEETAHKLALRQGNHKDVTGLGSVGDKAQLQASCSVLSAGTCPALHSGELARGTYLGRFVRVVLREIEREFEETAGPDRSLLSQSPRAWFVRSRDAREITSARARGAGATPFRGSRTPNSSCLGSHLASSRVSRRSPATQHGTAQHQASTRHPTPGQAHDEARTVSCAWTIGGAPSIAPECK